MISLTEYLKETMEIENQSILEIEETIVESKISSEEDFREYAENKFEKTFGDELDEEKMKKTIDGLLNDNKDLVDKGEWAELIGILNKSFNESVLESKYVTFSENELTGMSVDELWDAFEEAAAAKSACSIKKDKKGEAELADLITEIRKLIKSKR